MPVYTWSQTASANATADSTINFAEGQSPSSVNDSCRAVMAAVAKYRDDTNGALTTAGTATAYTLATGSGYDSLAHLDRQELTIVFHATSGLNPTLNVDSLGAKALNISTGVAVPNGYVLANTPYRLTFFNATNEFIPQGAAGGPVNDGRTTLASAATVNIGAASAKYIQITGTTTITAFDTIAAGAERVLEFAGSLILTNNAASLMLPGNVNIPTAAGDVAVFRSEGSGNWRCVNYMHAGGSPTGSVTTHGDSAYSILATDYIVATNATFTASRTWTLPAANSLSAGQTLSITDEANGVTSTNTLVVSRNGSDTILAQGATVTSITLASAGALIALISDGSSKWIVQNLRQAPQVSVFTSGSSQAYTTPAGALYLKVRMCGGGGGGGALITNAGSNGGDTSFGSWTALHGTGGPAGNTINNGGAGGTGGANGTGTVITRVDGGQGDGSTNASGQAPGRGGANPFAGPGAMPSYSGATTGLAARANTGGGGSGGTGSGGGGAGGGAGEYSEALIPAPAAAYTYTVGAGGNGGAAGTQAGGNGAAGRIEVTAYFQ